MRERRKTKENKSGSGAILKVKWPFYDMHFLDCCLQLRTTSGNVSET
jgi:hypothetical protein